MNDSLPANVDAEKTILGAVLLDNNCWPEVAEKLEPESFLLDSHKRIFRHMAELMERLHSVDIVTLANELSRYKEIESVGGVAYLASLTEGLPYNLRVPEYAAIVRDKALLRKVMEIGAWASDRAQDQTDSAAEVLGAVAERVRQASESAVSSPLQTFGSFIEQTYASIDSVFSVSAKDLGLKSGLEELDELTCGFQRKDLIIVAARPGLGKTALGLRFADTAAVDHDQTVAFFSLEMSRQALLHRLTAMRGGVNLQDVREGKWSDMTRRYAVEAMSDIGAAPLYVDDQKGQSVQMMQSKAARLKASTGHLDLVVIDQLNHIPLPAEARRSSGNRSQDLGVITRSLKGMAGALDVPVILLHQLNRGNEKRDNKEPWLSDLKDSGSVEEDADVVLFPHRPSYYDRNADDKERKKAVIIVGKQRQGPVGRADCEYISEQTLFRNVEVTAAGLWGRD